MEKLWYGFIYSLFGLVLCIGSNTLVAQEDPRTIYKKYELMLECPMYRCDLEGNKIDTHRLVAPIGAKFLLIEVRKELCVIRFLVDSRKIKKQRMNFKDDDVENNKYFSITKAQLDFKAVPANLQYNSFTLGSVISPLKLRLSMFDFGNAHVGLFSGIDFLSSSNINNDYYIYKNKPWVSIGLCYAIFSSSTMKK